MQNGHGSDTCGGRCPGSEGFRALSGGQGALSALPASSLSQIQRTSCTVQIGSHHATCTQVGVTIDPDHRIGATSSSRRSPELDTQMSRLGAVSVQ